MSPSHRRLFSSVMLLSVLFLATGCKNSFLDSSPEMQGTPFANRKLPTDMQGAPMQAAPSCSVIVYKEGKGPKKKTLSMMGPMVVQDALTQSKASKLFDRIKVTLMRTLPNGRVHKMDVKYNNTKNHIVESNNYSLQPGDRVVVTQDSTTHLDDMLESVVAPLGPALGHKH